MGRFGGEWWVTYSWMVWGPALLCGIITGVYYAFRQVFGYDNERLFGGVNIKDVLKSEVLPLLPSGVIPLLLTGIGAGSFAGKIYWTIVVSDEKTIYFLWAMVIAGLINGVIVLLIASKKLDPENQYFAGVFMMSMALGGSLLGGLLGVTTDLVEGGLGYLWGIGGGVLAFLTCWLMMGIMVFAIRGIAFVVFSAIASLLPPLRFRTIICQHCLRYTHPSQSRYETGRRYCEHCQKAVERTHIPGKVIFTFGTFTLKLDNDKVQLANPNFELIKRPGRMFICSNPGFSSAERGVDVSKLYIDTKTCEPHRLERFVTYMVHSPPTHGLQSVQILYWGELDDLGENLKNALRNTFECIELEGNV